MLQGIISLSLRLQQLVFFFHVNLFASLINKAILQHCQALVGENFETQAIFHSPSLLDGQKALIDVSEYVWVNIQTQFRMFQFCYQYLNLSFQCVGE